MQLPGWCLCLAVLGVFHVVMRQSWSEMIFSGSHFGVINPFHPLLAKLSGLMMVSTCLCYHHQHWLHPVRVRGDFTGAVWSSFSPDWFSPHITLLSPLLTESVPGVGVVGDVVVLWRLRWSDKASTRPGSNKDRLREQAGPPHCQLCACSDQTIENSLE